MKEKDKKYQVNAKLSQEVIDRWYDFAHERKMKKAEALSKIIIRGTKK